MQSSNVLSVYNSEKRTGLDCSTGTLYVYGHREGRLPTTDIYSTLCMHKYLLTSVSHLAGYPLRMLLALTPPLTHARNAQENYVR